MFIYTKRDLTCGTPTPTGLWVHCKQDCRAGELRVRNLQAVSFPGKIFLLMLM